LAWIPGRPGFGVSIGKNNIVLDIELRKIPKHEKY
jgi:hypothetical protein